MLNLEILKQLISENSNIESKEITCTNAGKTVDRREKLEEIYEIYKNLPLELQLSVVIETAYKIGTLNKFEIDENPPNEISLLEIDLINELTL